MKNKMIDEQGIHIPLRMCVACRKMQPKSSLFRVVKQDETVIIDGKGNANGRGAYLCKSKACIEKAQKIRALQRGLKGMVPDSIYNELIRSAD